MRRFFFLLSISFLSVFSLRADYLVTIDNIFSKSDKFVDICGRNFGLFSLDYIRKKYRMTYAKFYKASYECVKKTIHNENKKKYLYDLFTSELKKTRPFKTRKNWIKYAILLDLIDDIHSFDENFAPLTCHEDKGVKEKFLTEKQVKSYEVALFNYKKLKNLSEFNPRSSILKNLFLEHVGKGQMIESFYKNSRFYFNDFTRRTLTTYLGYGKRFTLTARAMVNFSWELGITPYEKIDGYINKKGVFVEGEFCRGSKYAFGTPMAKYRNVNSWFVRDYSEKAKKDIFYKVEEEKKKAKNNDLIISMVQGKLRFLKHSPGNLGVKQTIVGKVLNKEELNRAVENGENPFYFQHRYNFSLYDVFGRTKTIFMTQTKKFRQFKKESEKFLQNSLKKKKKKKFSSSEEQLIHQSQRDLLASIFNYFNRHKVVQVIQRLAPSDVHGYVVPTNGHYLTNEELISFLKEELREDSSIPEALKISEENVLSTIEKNFMGQQNFLSKDVPPYVSIYGLNQSVSTQALSYRPDVLSLNDRKILVMKHESGSVSAHIFIGATGVNDVNVVAPRGKRKQGDFQGNMKFGHDGEDKRKSPHGVKKLRLGDKLGMFPLNGSTIISLYLEKDYDLHPDIDLFLQGNYFFHKKFGPVEVELKVDMGDVLFYGK